MIETEPTSVKGSFDQLAKEMLGCIARGDLDGLERLSAPDMKVWHNFDGVVKSFDVIRGMLGQITGNAKRVAYEDIVVDSLERGWVQRHVFIIEDEKANVFRIPAAMFFTVNDEGKVCNVLEYLDGARLDEAIAAITAAPRRDSPSA